MEKFSKYTKNSEVISVTHLNPFIQLVYPQDEQSPTSRESARADGGSTRADGGGWQVNEYDSDSSTFLGKETTPQSSLAVFYKL